MSIVRVIDMSPCVALTNAFRLDVDGALQHAGVEQADLATIASDLAGELPAPNANA